MKNKQAPDFKLQSIDGSFVNLHQFRGKKVYLTFNRWSSCPFCTLSTNRIVLRSKTLQSKGIETLMVFPSAPKDIEINLPTKLDLNYTTFLSDTTLDAFKLYETRASLKGELNTLKDFKTVKQALKHAKWSSLAIQGKVFQLPSGFLINEDGVIELFKHGENLTDILDPEEVLEYVEGIQV